MDCRIHLKLEFHTNGRQDCSETLCSRRIWPASPRIWKLAVGDEESQSTCKEIVQVTTNGSVKWFTYSITFVRVNYTYVQSENTEINIAHE